MARSRSTAGPVPTATVTTPVPTAPHRCAAATPGTARAWTATETASPASRPRLVACHRLAAPHWRRRRGVGKAVSRCSRPAREAGPRDRRTAVTAAVTTGTATALGAGDLEVLADLDDHRLAVGGDDVRFVDTLGVGLHALDRGLGVLRQGRRAHLLGGRPAQQVLVRADALAGVELLRCLAHAGRHRVTGRRGRPRDSHCCPGTETTDQQRTRGDRLRGPSR